MKKVTETELIGLKNEALSIRDKITQAKGTYQSVLENIRKEEDNLRELGVNPEDVESVIKEKEDFIQSEFERISSEVLELKDKLV